MNRDQEIDLHEALHQAQEAAGPIEAYQLLETAVLDALGYCGVFRIARDPDPQNPRDGVNLSTLHLRFANSQIGDYGARSPDDYADEHILFKRKIYGYSHSGLVLSPNEFNCNFDSGLAGWQYVTHEMANAWGMAATPDMLEGVIEQFDQEIKDYNRYLSNDGYWVLNVLGDNEVYQVQADTFHDLLNDFDHDALRGLSADGALAARKCLEAAWEKREEQERL